MLTAASRLAMDLQAGERGDFLYWLRTQRGALAISGLLAFAAPVTFFTGALSVMHTPEISVIGRLGAWWTFYGFVLWLLLLVAGYTCERATRRFGRYARGGIWLVAACLAALLTNVVTAGRAAVLIEQGLVYNSQTMHLNGFTVSFIMALLYFAHLSRSREHDEAAARLAAAQAAQRDARHRIVQARLQEVQARIDPQMLFEMLDTLRHLYDHDAARAERFLDEFLQFLREALPRLRTTSSGLLREAGLARAFVRLHALAGAHDSDLTIEVAPEAMHARFPPGILLPLLDRVGRSKSGRCQLRAERLNDRCRVLLSLSAASSGASAARVESLLAELYGLSGTVTAANVSGATEILIEIPYEPA